MENKEVQDIMKSCEGKSKEEIRKILHTPQGKRLVQDIAKTIFPKKQ